MSTVIIKQVVIYTVVVVQAVLGIKELKWIKCRMFKNIYTTSTQTTLVYADSEKHATDSTSYQ
jgi:hypothetical protein